MFTVKFFCICILSFTNIAQGLGLQELGFNILQVESIQKIQERSHEDPNLFALRSHIYYKKNEAGIFQTVLLLGEKHQQTEDEALLALQLINHSQRFIVENFVTISDITNDSTLDSWTKLIAILSCDLFISLVIKPTQSYYSFLGRQYPSNIEYILENTNAFKKVELLESNRPYDEEFFTYLLHYPLSQLESLLTSSILVFKILIFDFKNPIESAQHTLYSVACLSFLRTMRYVLIGTWELDSSVLFTKREPTMVSNILNSLASRQSETLIAVMGAAHLEGVGQLLSKEGFTLYIEQD